MNISKNVLHCVLDLTTAFDLYSRRLHKDSPNILEVVEVIASKEFPQTGLHLVFQDALCPSAFLCKNVVSLFIVVKACNMTSFYLMFHDVAYDDFAD